MDFVQQLFPTIGLVDQSHAGIQLSVLDNGGLGIARGEDNFDVWLYPFGFFRDLGAVHAGGVGMPPVEGCNKKDYTVLFMIGVAVEN